MWKTHTFVVSAVDNLTGCTLLKIATKVLILTEAESLLGESAAYHHQPGTVKQSLFRFIIRKLVYESVGTLKLMLKMGFII